MKRSIGLAALTVLELPPAELISTAAATGYDCVGLRLIPVAGQKFQHPFDPGEVEQRLADTGVRVLDVEVFRLTPETAVGAFEPVMAAAARLKATQLLVHGADPDEARLIETFTRLCELAGGYRLAANLEPMPWVDVSSVAKAMRILEGAAQPNSGLLVDALHFDRAGGSLAELKSIPKKYLNYMQLCDARAERPSDMEEIIRQARGDRLFPGEGGLDLEGLLDALPDDLPISLEVPVAQALPPLERARRAIEGTKTLLRKKYAVSVAR